MDVFLEMKIADQVRAAFQQDPLIGRSDIGITVTAGKVYLAGKVESYFDSLHAQDVASRVAGVIGVRSGLVVMNVVGAKTDGEISDAIQRHFWRAPVVCIAAAAVSVQDGVATLSGVVKTFNEFESARQKAYDAGAKRVKNYLEVRE
jgi:osmotically-inducible protein OsmY